MAAHILAVPRVIEQMAIIDLKTPVIVDAFQQVLVAVNFHIAVDAIEFFYRRKLAIIGAIHLRCCPNNIIEILEYSWHEMLRKTAGRLKKTQASRCR